MKQSQQINHRNRISSYNKYLIHKAEKDDAFSFFKVLPVESATKSPQKSSRMAEHRTISYSDKPTGRYLPEKDASRLIIPEENTPARVKLPPIKRNDPLQGKNSPLPREPSGTDWQKYYNVHNLSTVNIDSSTLRLIQQNQKRIKVKKTNSISQQKSEL